MSQSVGIRAHNNLPVVSVILPVYNGETTLRETVDSILAQDYPSFEVVVVDDASRDGSVDILKSYGNDLKLYVMDHNSGICDKARHMALTRSSGTYAAFIDQDDTWKKEKLSRQVEYMECHPQFPLSHTSVQVIDSKGTVLEVRHQGRIPPAGPCAEELLKHCFITISSIMVRPVVWLKAIESHGMQHANSDLETFLYILKSFPEGFGFIPDVLGAYRRWPQSMSRQNWKWSPEDVNALDRVYSRGYWQGLLEKRDVRSLIAEAYWKNAEHWRHAGYPDRAWYFARRGLRYRPTWWKLYAAVAKAAVKMLKR